MSIASVQADPATTELPTNGVVQSGDITISQTVDSNSATMNIDQASQRGIVHWDTFNVGEQSTVNFNQPNAQAVTLNRITTANPSQIYGQINANGQVILENSSGIYFSPSAKIEVGGITATTQHITDDNFNNGSYQYEETQDSAVVNAGSIQALESYVALLAPTVRNEGVIVAHKGDVAMASGEQINLQFNDNNRLVSINSTPSLYNSLIENQLLVEAPGGNVILSASAVNQINGGLIKQSGKINVGSTTTIAKNEAGRIMISSNKVELGSQSQTLASAEQQGGEITIQANDIDVKSGSQVAANATQDGDGGSVSISAQNQLTLAGEINADGKQSGSGGIIQTTANTATIAESATISAQAGSAESSLAGEWIHTASSIALDQVAANVISNTLAHTDVTIQTTDQLANTQSHDITLNAGTVINNVSNTSRELTFIAHNALNLQGSMSDQNQQLILSATSFNNLSVGTVAQITANQVSFRATENINISGEVTSTGSASSNPLMNIAANNIAISGTAQTNNSSNPGRINLTATDAITLASSAQVRSNGNVGGVISFTADTMDLNGYIQTNGGVGRGGTVDISATQFIDLNQVWIQSNGFDGGGVYINSTQDSIVADQSMVQTNGSNGRGGTIHLHANNGNITYQGSVQSTGLTTGGNIQITANHIIINETSTITATGQYGGGLIQIGGSWQNSDSSVHQAITTTIKQNTLIDASAISNGNGGEIVIWSDITNPYSITTVSGTLYAKGGTTYGDGGRIETSGSVLKIDFINVSASASNGSYGYWLLDPYDYTINSSVASTINSALSGGTTVTVSTASNNGSYGSTGVNTNSGSIYVESDITASGSANFALIASKFIYLNADITTTGSQTYTGTVFVKKTTTSLSSNGGDITFNDDVFSVTGAESLIVNTGTGDITFNGIIGYQETAFATGVGNVDVNTMITGLSSYVDSTGLFLYAANAGGSTTVVGDIEFFRFLVENSADDITNGEEFSGIKMWYYNDYDNWGSPNTGNSALNEVLDSIRWTCLFPDTLWVNSW